jgi:ribosomal protein S18 acetylase RimI-like enzyme
MTFTLRAYEPADFEALSALDRACFPRGIAYSRREMRWYIEQPGADCVVAYTGDAGSLHLAGFIIAEASGTEAHIVTLDVAEAYRRAGAGTALLGEIERRLAARGVEQITLETATNNDAAVAFWQRHGFRTVGVIPRYYLNRLDAFFMSKQLSAAS